MSLSYVPGDCHVCHQSNVRVRRMKCGRHNYCRMCVEFVPRLVNGDFSCKVCSERSKMIETERRNKLDAFYAIQAGLKTEKPEVTVSLNGNNIIALEEPSEDDDLDGYNEQWEHLLKSVPDASCTTTSGVNPHSGDEENHTNSSENTMDQIPRKSSYIHLTLPLAWNDDGEPESVIHKPLIPNTVTGLLDSQNSFTKPERMRQGKSGPQALGLGRKPTKGCGFEPDPNEIERGTSPHKGLRPRGSYSWVADERYDGLDVSQSETEQLREQIGDIEGPSFICNSSSASEDSLVSPTTPRKLSFDEEFWDN